MAKVRRVTHRSATSSPRSSRTRASLSQSIGDVSPGGDFVGPWYAWWPGDPLPALPPLPGFSAAPADDDRAFAALARLGHEPNTTASARGILKAGLGRVGDVYLRPAGRLELVPVGPIERARAGAAVLGAALL